MVSQIVSDYLYILAGIGIGFVGMIFYLIMVRLFISVIIWACIVGVVGGCGYLGYYFINMAVALKA